MVKIVEYIVLLFGKKNERPNWRDRISCDSYMVKIVEYIVPLFGKKNGCQNRKHSIEYTWTSSVMRYICLLIHLPRLLFASIQMNTEYVLLFDVHV